MLVLFTVELPVADCLNAVDGPLRDTYYCCC